MYYYVTELDSRPDGIINSSITNRSSLALGLSLYYQRAAAAVTSEQFTGVALTLQDQNGNIILNGHFDTIYVAPEPDPEPVEDADVPPTTTEPTE